MPIYEYECLACRARTEALQRISEPPLTTCRECGGALKKLISPAAFQFKGSGWYVTDYARAKPASGDGDGAAKTEGAGDGAAKTGADDKGGAAKPATASSKGATSGE